MSGITNREYRMRLKWLDEQWNKPDRHDHYIMALTRAVDRQYNDKRKERDLKDFKVPFKEVVVQPEPTTEEERERYLDMALMAWKIRVGIKE